MKQASVSPTHSGESMAIRMLLSFVWEQLVDFKGVIQVTQTNGHAMTTAVKIENRTFS